MNSPLYNQFDIQITRLTGAEFQNFINKLFSLHYGIDDFISLRHSGDKGCDGIIKSKETIIACYGPGKYDKPKFLKKAKEDFESYQHYWEKDYPNWLMLVNHELSPDQILFVDDLQKKAILLNKQRDFQIKGKSYLVQLIINSLKSYQRRKLGLYLKIDTQYLNRDYLKEILEELLKEETDSQVLKYQQPIYIEDKIILNFDEEDREIISDEFIDFADEFTVIQDLLSVYNNTEIERLKSKIRIDHNRWTGTFKQKLTSQIDWYVEKYAHGEDDDYQYFIRAILFYVFEQCFIGKKTKNEKL